MWNSKSGAKQYKYKAEMASKFPEIKFIKQ